MTARAKAEEARIRAALCGIVGEHGSGVIADERRCVALMNDFCPRSRLLNILCGALRTGVLREMSLVNDGELEDEARRAVERLQHDHAWSSENAEWAVDVWLEAFEAVAVSAEDDGIEAITAGLS